MALRQGSACKTVEKSEDRWGKVNLLPVSEVPALRESIYRGETQVDIWKVETKTLLQVGASVVFKGKVYDLTDFSWQERLEGCPKTSFSISQITKESLSFKEMVDKTGLTFDELAERLDVKASTMEVYYKTNKPSVSIREGVEGILKEKE